jgi:uncharacterized protein YhaN
MVERSLSMFLVELVMQGVRGIRQVARLRLQSGFNLVSAGNESGKTTAVDTLQRLLFPPGQPEAVQTLVSRYTPDASRAALVLCSDDGLYYRVIQDFVKTAVNLSKYEPASKEFNLLHKDWDGTRKVMGGLTAGISAEEYRRVFTLRREHSTERSSSLQAVSERLPVPGKPVPAAASSESSGQARLAELRETLCKAEEAADADYQYQSAKLALEEIKKKLSVIDEMDNKNAEIEASLNQLKVCEALPENLNEVLEEYESKQGQKRAEAEDLRKELESLETQASSIPMSNIVTDKLFLLGAALGVLSIVGGLYILTEAHAYLFPVGVILSLMLMVVAWYNGSRKNAQVRAMKKEADAVRNELNELEREAVHDGAVVAAYMRSTGAATTGELKEKAENYRHFKTLLQDHEEERKRILGDLTPEALRQQYRKRQEEALLREQAARAVAHNAVDTYTVRQEIERLETASQSPAQNWDAGSFDHVLPTTVFDTDFSELAAASRIGGIDMETLLPAVAATAQRNLSAVTGGRYVRIDLGHEGPMAVHTKDNSVFNFTELSHGTKALVYFCFRAGIVEELAGKRPLPFILDDALAGCDPARQQAACQILRALGTKIQVLLFTSNPALRAAGDVVLELN